MSDAIAVFLVERAAASVFDSENEEVRTTLRAMLDALVGLGHTVAALPAPPPGFDRVQGFLAFTSLVGLAHEDIVGYEAAKRIAVLLQDCARTKLRNDPLTPEERTYWIAISTAAYGLRQKAATYKKAQYALWEERMIEYDEMLAEARFMDAMLAEAVAPALEAVGAAAEAAVVAAAAAAVAAAVAAPPHPLGGIHLGAFGADPQNVHTAPAQQSTARAIALLRTRPLAEGGPSDYLYDLHTRLQATWLSKPAHPVLTRFFHDDVQMELMDDLERLVAFDCSYCDILCVVWTFMREQPHEPQQELHLRFAEEIVDGVGMCAQGKMTRLVNVLRGFDPALDEVPALSLKEQLQARMATVAALPLAERAAAAAAVFADLHISAEDQAPWVEALLDA